jgi:hypothetical protein
MGSGGDGAVWLWESLFKKSNIYYNCEESTPNAVIYRAYLLIIGCLPKDLGRSGIVMNDNNNRCI